MSEAQSTAHTVRVPAPLWTAARTRALTRRETVSDVIRRALEAYTAPEDEGIVLTWKAEDVTPDAREYLARIQRGLAPVAPEEG